MDPRGRATNGRSRGWQRGFLGYYALSVIGRERIYAYQLAARIAEKTQGAWQPGPGAIYPALRSLAARGLIRGETREGQRRYQITPAGRRRLAEVRSERRRWADRFAGSWRLTIDLVDPADRADMALRRLRAAVGLVDALATGTEDLVPPSERRRLRRSAARELAEASARWSRGVSA